MLLVLHHCAPRGQGTRSAQREGRGYEAEGPFLLQLPVRVTATRSARARETIQQQRRDTYLHTRTATPVSLPWHRAQVHVTAHDIT